MRRRPTPACRPLAPLFLLASALVPGARADGIETMLFYVAEGDRLVFTNTADEADARPLPGWAPGAVPTALDVARPVLPASIYDPFIDRLGVEYGVPAELIKAVAVVESGLDPHAVSVKGAQGLMQLMPATATRYGVSDAFDPLENLRAGAAHLRDLLHEFDGDLTLALAAYNAGSGAVRRAGGVPAYRETRTYVTRVRSRLGDDPQAQVLPAAEVAPAETPARPIRMIRQADGSLLLVN